jgi:hypothetical protein
MERTLKLIEDELDRLQLSYINEEDDMKHMEIERKFDQLLDEATTLDGILRIAAGLTINNWIRSE